MANPRTVARVSARIKQRVAHCLQFELNDRLGQTTRVEFNDIQFNPILDTDEFRFKIPEGADVIDESAI